MIVRVLLAAALFVRLPALVSAVPQHFQRDVSCVATSTVTVTATIAAASSSHSSNNSGASPESQPASVATTQGGASSPSSVIGGSGTTASGQDVLTVTVISTVTVTSISQQATGANGGQQATGTDAIPQTTAAPSASGGQATGGAGPGAVTVTVTVTSDRVITSTILQTETVTATQTLVQTVTQSAAVAPNTAGASAGSGGQPSGATGGAGGNSAGVFSTITADIVVSRPASQPSLPSVYPHYTNTTGPYSNSTNSSSAAESSGRVPIPFLPTPGSSTILRASPTPGVQFANTSSPASSTIVLPSATPSASYSNGTSSLPSNSSSSGYENSLYFANWAIYGANYQPQSLPASSVTRIHYAFADIDDDGTVVSSDSWADTEKHYANDSWSESGTNAYGCVKQLYLLKQSNRGLKVLLAIGGWTWSSKFSPVAADATMRQTFADSAVQLVTDWGFDGVDIDWEFNAYDATAADTQNFVLLLQAVRAAFDAWSAANAPDYRFLITVASPAGPSVYGLLDLAAMDAYVDTWNLMAYDYAGSWSTVSAHQANVYANAQDEATTPYSTDVAVSAYVAAGIAAHKILMGLPLYGRSFEGTAGLGDAYTSVGAGDPTLGAGQWRYSALPRAGATELFDPVAVAAYSYDAASQELISYDNLQSATAKAAYLAGKGLGGAMFWEASDDKSGNASLVVAMAGLLGGLDAAQNLLSYPTSQYDNIRDGMSG